jgi:hypothetical protein
MKDQVHIRNAEAAQLARTLARQTGKTINEVVLEALRRFRVTQNQPRGRDLAERWRSQLRSDQAHVIQPETPIESFYNDDTGLPE